MLTVKILLTNSIHHAFRRSSDVLIDNGATWWKSWTNSNSYLFSFQTDIFKHSVQELEATFTSATKTHEYVHLHLFQSINVFPKVLPITLCCVVIIAVLQLYLSLWFILFLFLLRYWFFYVVKYLLKSMDSWGIYISKPIAPPGA